MSGDFFQGCEKMFRKATEKDIDRISEIYDEITDIADSGKLIPVMEMNYVRREIRLDTGLSIDVLSVDEGEIKTANGTLPILELEIELYTGDKDDMIALGRKLEEKYHLKRGNRSKYQRGLELLGFL